MSMRITQQNSSISNNVQLTQELPRTVTNEVLNTPITISSLRESVYTEPSSTLCQNFSNFINWIKDNFLWLFGFTSNNNTVFNESTLSAAPIASTHLIEIGQRTIDDHFARLDQPFPLKVTCCIQLNNRILTIPFSNIATDPSAFIAEAKRALREALHSQNLQAGNTIKIKTFFLKSATADSHQNPLSQGPFYQIKSYHYHYGHLGEINSSGYDTTNVLNIRETQDYMFINTEIPSEQSDVIQFLMS